MPIYKDEARKTWYVKTRYTDWQGKRKETTKRGFATKREAKEWEEEFHRSAGGTSDMSLKSLSEIYLKDCEKRLRKQTVYQTRNVLRKHILPYLGDTAISQITPNIIRQWQNEISGLGLSDGYTHLINVKLSTVLSFAVKFYGLPKNPMQITGKSGGVSKREDFWEPSEFEKFLSVVKAEEERLLFALMFLSGVRIGEALALSPNDFDFEKKTISITKSISLQGDITMPKTKSSCRVISMPESIMLDMKRYISKYYDTPERVFMMSRSAVARKMERYAKRAGVPHITPHGLRHSHASYLIHSGIPATAISKRLGHANPSITLNTYSHVYNQSDTEIAALLEQKMCGQNVVIAKNATPRRQ